MYARYSGSYARVARWVRALPGLHGRSGDSFRCLLLRREHPLTSHCTDCRFEHRALAVPRVLYFGCDEFAIGATARDSYGYDGVLGGEDLSLPAA